MSLSIWLPYLSIAVIICSFLALALTKKEPEIIFGSALMSMVVLGMLPISEALSGFASSGLITVTALFVVAAAIKEAGLIQPLLAALLKNVSKPIVGLLRVLLPVSALSAFLNNTPIVAALIPGIRDWCREHENPNQWNKKYFLLPLSYAAVLGGTCTLIGTSTNVLVYGFLINDGAADSVSFFSIGIVGIPLTLLGILFLLVFSRKILNVSDSYTDPVRDTRQYTVEMMLAMQSELIGKTVEDARLRHLKGVYLVEILRRNLIIPVVSSTTVLEPEDRLIFTGDVNAISDLMAVEGLIPAENKVFDLQAQSGNTNLVEAILGAHNDLIGRRIRNVGFRRKYNASVLAVVRDGNRVLGKVGDIRLKAGDTLLLLAKRSFVENYQYSKELILVSRGKTLSANNSKEMFKAGVITLLFVIAAVSGFVPIVTAAIIAALLMVVSGTISVEKARKSIDLQVIFVIGAAFGIGTGLKSSGGAELIANGILSFTGDNPFALLVATYLITMILTELVTNNAAAVIAYSLVSGVVSVLGYNIVPFAITIMIAASASFISPLGYQTNLMVYSAGRYRFSDYLKLGTPLSLLSAGLTLTIVPLAWRLS